MFRFNPFKPNSIAGPGMFAGRGDELKSLDQALFQTKNGNPWHFLIHGERGIGKSSLMYCVELVAQGKIPPWYSSEPAFNFVTVSIELGPDTRYQDIVTKIGSEFVRKIRMREAVKLLFRTSGFDFLGISWAGQIAGPCHGGHKCA